MLEHLQQLAVHCYYAGEHAAGRRAIERLLRSELPPEAEMLARCNRTWYTQRLDELIDCKYRQIAVEPAHEGWSLFNPALTYVNSDLVALVRSSNYRIVDGRYQIPPEDGSTIRTDQILVKFDSDLRPVSSRVVTVPDYPHTDYPVVGLEDCRLRLTATGLGVSATVRNAAPWTDGRCRMATADLDLKTAEMSNLLVLDGLAAQQHEKNWMPIMAPGRGWLYCCWWQGYTATVDPDPAIPGGWQLARRHESPRIAKEFRGGSQLIPWRGGWLCLVHEVAHCGGHRSYEHRFVWFDDLRLTKVSPSFAFLEPRSIEFAAGLAAVDGRLVASFGLRDAEAWLVDLPGDQVWQLLEDA